MPVQRPISIVLPPCGVLAAESVHQRPFEMALECHAFHELYYLCKGSLTYFEQGRQAPLRLEAGDFHAIPQGLGHRIEDHGASTLLLLCLSARYVSEHPIRAALWTRLCKRSNLPLSPDPVDRFDLEQGVRRILAEQRNQAAEAELAIQAETDRILLRLARLPDRAPQSDAKARVRGVLQLVSETYFEPWLLDVAAEHACLSRRRFSDLCRQLEGQTFLQFLTRVRLEHAARLLQETQSSIYGVAFSCGFSDPRHFYRLFQRHYNTSPGQWRDTRGGEAPRQETAE